MNASDLPTPKHTTLNGRVIDLPTPNRVTLTDEEREALWLVEHAPIEATYTAVETILAAREQTLREAYDVAADEWATDYADWMANNPGSSGIPSDPPMLDTYLARGGA